MKQYSIFLMIIVLCLIAFSTFSQSDSIPLHRQFPTVPAFKLMKTDSSFFVMNETGKKKMPTVIIIFSPTCGHCRHQAEEITSHMQALKYVNFIFCTAYPVPDMVAFIANYGLDKFTNIAVGHDAGYMLGTFYKINSLPGIFVYDKKRKLKKQFETNVTAQNLLDALK